MQLSRLIGWALFTLGLLALIGFAAFEIAVDDSESIGVKIALAALAAGFVVLFATVLRQRLIERKTDKYEDVQV